MFPADNQLEEFICQTKDAENHLQLLKEYSERYYNLITEAKLILQAGSKKQSFLVSNIHQTT